ncbi:2-C-methyl-D-erythritol 4-phosphate cytidylyltransferase [Pedobacter metabolipauper]|uniref:2-C-methyl-D-erythritol 4-phosphate cytidylyltransferase n=1 Tax=Pedobacter metabolipauper TaxID=425513 RepID=A0A4R6SX77_9SPHI|nr:2-C-methyl-D-erythritol 4-phosphate cytidylyltransferase [Pedobacter metabolipauper]TDQ11124.1 2-C-methyl-D-erythritol 4-phosphate cytidylyltransferase [Pedobacter metabolipauper]
MKYYAILVAGGSGNRMNTTVAKQFLLLNGRPVLMHTIEAFHQCVLNPDILLVLNIHQQGYWKELCQKYNFEVPHRIINGGAQRYHSVKNGLDAIEGNGVVAVHDAVRPLISPALILESFKVAEEKGNCIVGITPTDSIRNIAVQPTVAISRTDLILVQTPQTFRIDVLRAAYQTPYRSEFTDDASVAEYAGYEINTIEGARENIKITYPEDLEIASILIKKGVTE